MGRLALVAQEGDGQIGSGAAKPDPRRSRAWTDLPWFFLVLAVLPTHREFLICLGVVVVMCIAFRVQYYPREWLLFASGSALGLIFELGGDAIYKLQSWSEGSLFGIPAWLPLFWGLGFVFIRRFGNTIVRAASAGRDHADPV